MCFNKFFIEIYFVFELFFIKTIIEDTSIKKYSINSNLRGVEDFYVITGLKKLTVNRPLLNSIKTKINA